MEQNKKESTEEQDQNPGSSYDVDVHASGSNAPTIVGNNSTFIEDHRQTHFQQVHVVVQQATFIQPDKGTHQLQEEQKKLEAISDVPVVSKDATSADLHTLPPGKDFQDSKDLYDDIVPKAPKSPGYLPPVTQVVKERIGHFEQREQNNNQETSKRDSEKHTKDTSKRDSEKHTRDTGNYNVGEDDLHPPFDLEANSSNGTLAEQVTKFCKSTNDIDEQARLTESIQAKLNSLSINFSQCTICPAEYTLRSFLLEDDAFQVRKGIGIYASILAVMLQHGMQPLSSDEKSIQHLLPHLQKIAEPPNFYPSSSLRRDIETVLKIIPAFAKILKEEKIEKAIKLIAEIKKNPKTEMMRQYLENKSWTQHYLIISWLKVQALVLKNKDVVIHFFQLIEYLSKLLKKMDQSYRWKFTITVVESIVQIAREISDRLEIRKMVISGLSKLHLVLQEKDLYQCINIFHQHARKLVFHDNLHIRIELLGGIYKELDTTSEEMCKERIKLCKNLKLSAISEECHNSSHARFFSAQSNNSKVIVKCYKQTKRDLITRYSDPHPKHFDYEYDTLSRLQHPNVIQLLACDQQRKCLTLELVSKGSLLTFLRNRRGSTLIPKLMDLLQMALMIAEALEFLEKNKIIHLAIQAANVLLHGNGIVKLTGFQFSRTQKQIEKTGVQMAIEKRHFKWMDPQALLFESISQEIVSWSFGVFLYELLTLGCVPYNHVKRRPLNSLQAQVFVVRDGILEKESCIPESIFSIISTNCLLKDYSSRASPQELKELLQKLINDDPEICGTAMVPPPRLIYCSEDFNSENCNPGTTEYDDELPFVHLEIVDHVWNQQYHGQEFVEEGYSNADPSEFTPHLCIIKRQEKKALKQWKEIRVLEYMEFKDIKLVKKLQELKYRELVMVIAVNPFGPYRLEMISESLPQGNVLDALLKRPELRKNVKSYIRQAGLAVNRLHEQGIVHRNLKVENYLMENDQTIKLGRLGMSMEEADVNVEYCNPKDVKMIPDARRNAPEVLSYHSYTRKSDVWSFGVVMWVFSKLASLVGTRVTRKDVLPYSEISDKEVTGFVMDKNLLPNPDTNSSHLYDVYKTCWQWNVEDRPSISAVLESITTSNNSVRVIEEIHVDVQATEARDVRQKVGGSKLLRKLSWSGSKKSERFTQKKKMKKRRDELEEYGFYSSRGNAYSVDDTRKRRDELEEYGFYSSRGNAYSVDDTSENPEIGPDHTYENIGSYTSKTDLKTQLVQEGEERYKIPKETTGLSGQIDPAMLWYGTRIYQSNSDHEEENTYEIPKDATGKTSDETGVFQSDQKIQLDDEEENTYEIPNDAIGKTSDGTGIFQSNSDRKIQLDDEEENTYEDPDDATGKTSDGTGVFQSNSDQKIQLDDEDENTYENPDDTTSKTSDGTGVFQSSTTQNEYSTVCDDVPNISLAPSTTGHVSENVDDERNLTDEQISSDAHDEDEELTSALNGSAEEVALNIGRHGHVANLIARFSSSHR